MVGGAYGQLVIPHECLRSAVRSHLLLLLPVWSSDTYLHFPLESDLP